MSLLLQQVEQAYREGQPAPPTPFAGFVKYLEGMDGQAADNFWRGQLEGWSGHDFPALPSATYQPRTDRSLRHTIGLPAQTRSGTTRSTAVRAAWATVVQDG
jgi:hypothetical protein